MKVIPAFGDPGDGHLAPPRRQPPGSCSRHRARGCCRPRLRRDPRRRPATISARSTGLYLRRKKEREGPVIESFSKFIEKVRDQRAHAVAAAIIALFRCSQPGTPATLLLVVQ